MPTDMPNENQKSLRRKSNEALLRYRPFLPQLFRPRRAQQNIPRQENIVDLGERKEDEGSMFDGDVDTEFDGWMDGWTLHTTTSFWRTETGHE